MEDSHSEIRKEHAESWPREKAACRGVPWLVHLAQYVMIRRLTSGHELPMTRKRIFPIESLSATRWSIPPRSIVHRGSLHTNTSVQYT